MSGIQDGVMARDTLFGRLSRGEPEALDEVRGRYGERVAQVVGGLMGPTFTAILEDGNLSSESAFLGWITAVVERRILQAAGRVMEKMEAEPVPSEGSRKRRFRSGRSGRVAEPERAGRVTVALSRLSPPDREMIIGRIVLQIPWEAMARSLGLSVDAAQMRLVRARRRTAALLGERDFPASDTSRNS